MESALRRLEDLIWGWPMLCLLLGSGLWLLLRLRLRPLRELPLAMKLLLRRRDREGGVTAFGALCTALSATVGTGNLVGVATALWLGGPGALLWMELSAVTGLSLKYAEGVLAVRFRYTDPAGRPCGGPFAYIRLGLGPGCRPLAKCFSVLGAAAGLCGVGSFVQVGSVSACLETLLERSHSRLPELSLPWGTRPPLICGALGLATALLAWLVICRGMEGVSRLSARLVPLMGGLYLGLCLWVLIRHGGALPDALRQVLRGALCPEAAGGGLMGTVMAGVSRGVFSNEAGLGTAPIAAAAVRGVSPREQGLISMTAVVFDTMLICTLTGLVILVTGCQGGGLTAALQAFCLGLPLPETLTGWLIFLVLALFAFTTVVGWSCIGAACLDDLTGGSRPLRRGYLILYCATAALAPFCSPGVVWTAANICNGLMALPNVTGILLLSRQVLESTRQPLDFCGGMGYNTPTICRNRRENRHAAKALRDRRAGRHHHPLGPGCGTLRFGEDRPQRPGDKI